MKTAPEIQPYNGFEQGPIRPPSEARSLLVRVTRNCHWNRCAFCPVYKGTRFSIRPVGHVLRDLDTIAAHIHSLTLISAGAGLLLEDDVRELFRSLPRGDHVSFRAALSWYLSGMESVFLQDADCLVVKPPILLEILCRLKNLFPMVKRVTAYSRSDTIDRIALSDLQALGSSGLNRIHIGMESGADRVLEMVCKGATKEIHVRAGLKVREAGIQLSEYYMPGLGGIELSRENALETADAVSRINPDFVRLRTLAIPDRAPLAKEFRTGSFRKCNDIQSVEEILLFLENITGCDGYLTSDHALNLFPEVEGSLSQDLDGMIALLRRFLSMEPEMQRLFQLGRRLGVFSTLADMDNPGKRAEALEAIVRLGVTADNVDEITDAIMKRFI
jgi:hypothetical protein